MRSRLGAAIAACVVAPALTVSLHAADGSVTWRVDNLEEIGGHAVTVAGSPRVVPTDIGPAVAFNGVSDGLFVEASVLEGLSRFTLDLVFQPDADGPGRFR